MTKELSHWLDNLLEEIAGVEVRRKSTRRVRLDVDADALPALLELLQGRLALHRFRRDQGQDNQQHSAEDERLM